MTLCSDGSVVCRSNTVDLTSQALSDFGWSCVNRWRSFDAGVGYYEYISGDEAR